MSEPELQRVLYLVVFSGLGIVLLLGFGLFHLAIGFRWMAALNFTMAAITAGNLVWLYRRRRLARTEDVCLGVLAVSVFACLYGNVDHTGPYWFFLFPVIAFYLKGPRRGFGWMAVMLGELLLAIALQAADILHTDSSLRALVILVIALATATTLTAAYQWVIASTQAELSQRSRQLADEVLQRHSVEQSLHRVEEKVRFLTRKDSVTELPNRATYDDCLQLAGALARRYRYRFAVALIDIDGFGGINQAYGHEAGDHLLRAFGQRLRRTLRESDGAARIGADAFGLLLWDISEPLAARTALERLRNVLERPYNIGGRQITIRVSAGLAAYPHDAWDPESLLYEAQNELDEIREGKRAAIDLAAGHSDPVQS